MMNFIAVLRSAVTEKTDVLVLRYGTHTVIWSLNVAEQNFKFRINAFDVVANQLEQNSIVVSCGSAKPKIVITRQQSKTSKTIGVRVSQAAGSSVQQLSVKVPKGAEVVEMELTHDLALFDLMPIAIPKIVKIDRTLVAAQQHATHETNGHTSNAHHQSRETAPMGVGVRQQTRRRRAVTG